MSSVIKDEAINGPTVAPMPYINKRPLDTVTYSLGSAKSLAYATAMVYSGNASAPHSTANTFADQNCKVGAKKKNTTPTIHPPRLTATSTFRRPILSERMPNGHCAIAPPITAEVMNQAARDTSLPTLIAKTGASAQNDPLARPVTRQPSAPDGEIRKSLGKLTETVWGCSGGGDVDNATGTAPIETSTDAIMKMLDKHNIADNMASELMAIEKAKVSRVADGYSIIEKIAVQSRSG